MHAYVVVSLLTGAGTEELRALTWSHLDLEGDASGLPPTPPSIQLWRSCGQVVRQRRSDPAEPWSCRRSASTRSANTDNASWPSGFGWGSGGLTTISCSPLDTAARPRGQAKAASGGLGWYWVDPLNRARGSSAAKARRFQVGTPGQCWRSLHFHRPGAQGVTPLDLSNMPAGERWGIVDDDSQRTSTRRRGRRSPVQEEVRRHPQHHARVGGAGAWFPSARRRRCERAWATHPRRQV
jgi:hypothetical protein